MGKYAGFLTALGLMILIPAVVYVVFSDGAPEKSAGDFPTASVQGSRNSVEKSNDRYKVTLRIPNPPLKTGSQHLVLQVQALKALNETNSQAKAHPEVTLTMPMGKESMTGTAQIQPLAQPEQYDIQADFSMAGQWFLNIKPGPGEKAIQIVLKAQ